MPKKSDRPEVKSENKDDVQQVGTVCLIGPQVSLRPGMICPRCKAAKIEYNGMLNLVCPNCGLTEAGAST
jgi:hypothetical protein